LLQTISFRNILYILNCPSSVKFISRRKNCWNVKYLKIQVTICYFSSIDSEICSKSTQKEFSKILKCPSSVKFISRQWRRHFQCSIFPCEEWGVFYSMFNISVWRVRCIVFNVQYFRVKSEVYFIQCSIFPCEELLECEIFKNTSYDLLLFINRFWNMF
jgi:hypothetical protein